MDTGSSQCAPDGGHRQGDGEMTHTHVTPVGPWPIKVLDSYDMGSNCHHLPAVGPEQVLKPMGLSLATCEVEIKVSHSGFCELVVLLEE
jgi:hypothetical protein